MARTAADDERDALVSVEQLAFGLAALDCPVWVDVQQFWLQLGEVEREEHRARARFALGVAEEVPAPSTNIRWLPEDEVDRRGLRDRVVQPGGPTRAALLSGLPASEPHPVQLGDQRAECTCGRWQFEVEPEPSKHLGGCEVQHLVKWSPS